MKQHKVFAWNPNGIRALLRNASTDLQSFVRNEQPDILFFPETKGNPTAEAQVNKDMTGLFTNRGWEYYHAFSERPGRFGTTVAIATDKIQVLQIWRGFGKDVIDPEGRVLATSLLIGYATARYRPNRISVRD